MVGSSALRGARVGPLTTGGVRTGFGSSDRDTIRSLDRRRDAVRSGATTDGQAGEVGTVCAAASGASDRVGVGSAAGAGGEAGGVRSTAVAADRAVEESAKDDSPGPVLGLPASASGPLAEPNTDARNPSSRSCSGRSSGSLELRAPIEAAVSDVGVSVELAGPEAAADGGRELLGGLGLSSVAIPVDGPGDVLRVKLCGSVAASGGGGISLVMACRGGALTTIAGDRLFLCEKRSVGSAPLVPSLPAVSLVLPEVLPLPRLMARELGRGCSCSLVGAPISLLPNWFSLSTIDFPAPPSSDSD